MSKFKDNPCREIIISALSEGMHPGDNDKGYGVKYDEMGSLSSLFDPYDITPFNGPDPPIQEITLQPNFYTCFCHEEGDFGILQMAYDIIRPGYTVIFNGSRRSGKTKLIRNLCQRLRPWYPEIIIFTRTKASGEYFSFVPICRVVEGFDPELFLEIVNIQREKKKKLTRGELEDVNTNILIILDDCLADKLQYSNELDSAFFEGRHLDITIFVSIQDIKGCAPRATTNCDISFIFPFGDERSFEAVRDKYCNFISKNQLRSLLTHPKFQKKYHFFCFDMAHKYNPVDYRVSFGCVDDRLERPFVMGERKIWKDSRSQLRDLGMDNMMNRDDWGILKPSQYQQYQNEQYKRYRRQVNHTNTNRFLDASGLRGHYQAPGSGNYERGGKDNPIQV
jgi:hypothetical protein